MRQVIPEAIKLIKGTEKCSLKAYQGKADPPGVLTIGYGHVIGRHESYLKAGITQQKADELFAADVAEHSKYIDEDLKALKPVDGWVYGALASLLYNAGPRGLQGFPSITGPMRQGNVTKGVLAMWKVNKSGKPLEYRDGLFYRRLQEMWLALAHKLVAKPDECIAARKIMADLAVYGDTKEMVAYFNSAHRKDKCITCSRSKH